MEVIYATLTPLGRFPSMASFLFRQSAQRKGPCHGFELVEKMEPAWTEMPSLGARSTWHTTQVNMFGVPCPDPLNSTVPSLQHMNIVVYHFIFLREESWKKLWQNKLNTLMDNQFNSVAFKYIAVGGQSTCDRRLLFGESFMKLKFTYIVSPASNSGLQGSASF